MNMDSDSSDVMKRLMGLRPLVRGATRRPHKYLFMLALARLYKADRSRERCVPLDDALINEFASAVKDLLPHTDPKTVLIEYPFYHLTSDGFWSLNLLPGKAEQFNTYSKSPHARLTLRRLLETVESGCLDSEFDLYLRDPSNNALVQRFLIDELAAIAADQGHGRPSTSLFAHEASAMRLIEQQVMSHKLGEILTNLELHDPQSNRYLELDVALITRFGVYVVELKHWSGRIEIRPHSWIQNGSVYKPDPHKVNNFKAKLLRGLCERQFPQFSSVYFESVVVLTNPDVSVTGGSIPTTTKHNPTFDSIDRFVKYVRHHRDTSKMLLTESQCVHLADYVRRLHSPSATRGPVFPGYEVVDTLYQHVDRAELVAKRTDLRHRKLSRLRIFFPPANVSKQESDEAHEKATATLNAVAKIGDHPNILKVWSVPNENNFVVEGSDWSEAGTLRDVLEREAPLDHVRASSITDGLLRGLDAVHEQCVIHRQVSPENVLMADDTPKLMNFDLSFQLEDDRITVIPDASKLKRTPYTAPEVYAGGTTPEASADLFSIGVILYEMLTGASPFGCSTDLEQLGGGLGSDHQRELSRHNAPKHLVDLIVALVQQSPATRPGNAKGVLERLVGEESSSAAVQEVNPRLTPGDRHGLYAIEEFLTYGAESQIYRALGARGRQVALKLFDMDVPLQRVVDEQRFVASIHHPCIVRADSANQWTDGRYYIPFEWVPGHSLRSDIDAEQRPDIDQFFSAAGQLLDALAALHDNADEGQHRPVLHNDIKPENVLLESGGRPVLVDFGAASEPHVGTYEGTEGYVAPDLRLGQDRKYCEDGDRYALGVTLCEWLTGQRDHSTLASAPGIPHTLREWLQNAISPEASNRFAGIEEMREAFDAAIPRQEPLPAEEGAEPLSSVSIPAVEPLPTEDLGEVAAGAEPEELLKSLAGDADPNTFD